MTTDTTETIFEDLADRLATARTRYLMGDPTEGRRMLQAVRMDYLRYREVLADVPGVLALREAMEGAGEVVGI